jgi:hypothetical protein
MAIEAFISIQVNTLHVKEPFLAHPSYLRILKALDACLGASTPHIFLNEDNTTTASATSPEVTQCDAAVSPTDLKEEAEDLLERVLTGAQDCELFSF